MVKLGSVQTAADQTAMVMLGAVAPVWQVRVSPVPVPLAQQVYRHSEEGSQREKLS
jgi:hypothetical protein